MSMIAVPLSPDVSRLFREIDVPGERDASDHITLFYLGDDTPIEQITKAVQAIYKVTQDMKPFLVTAKRITTFPRNDARTSSNLTKGYPVIAELAAPELTSMRDKLRRVFERSGIKFDNTYPDYKPHVSLSYSKKKPKIIRFPQKLQFQVSCIALYGGNETDERIFVNFPFSLGVEKKSAYLELLADQFYKLA
jgi:2'-5' RNA ligase